MYVGVVVAYNPQREEICKNIDTYINELDVLYVVDNSSKNNGDIFNGYNKVKYIPNYDNLGIYFTLLYPLNISPLFLDRKSVV